MHQGELLVVLSLLTLSLSQSSDDTCKCTSSVVVMTKEELRQEIQAQAMTSTSTTAASTTNCDFNVSRVTDELYAKIVRLDAEKLVDLQEAINCPCETASSCKHLLQKNPSSHSGYYWLRNSPTTSVKAYCDFTKTAGGVTGGWMKVAELDMTNSTEECPPGYIVGEYNQKRLCAINSHRDGCPISVYYHTHGIPYSEVYGRIIGYQKGRTSGIHPSYSGLNGDYIDGVSLTHGNRFHIWSFVAAYDETGGSYACHCTNRNRPGHVPPHYVGLDYFCDTGSEQYQQYTDDFTVFDDPLWDGAGCGPLDDCCRLNNPPWFYKKLTYTTIDNIEMRVCRNSGPLYENVLIEKIDIYIR